MTNTKRALVAFLAMVGMVVAMIAGCGGQSSPVVIDCSVVECDFEDSEDYMEDREFEFDD